MKDRAERDGGWWRLIVEVIEGLMMLLATVETEALFDKIGN